MKKLIGAVVALICGVSFAADLRWVNWDGDLKAGTASNWEPAQVPQTGDNLTICWTGAATKTWHNNLDIEYGHVTIALTNSSARIDIDTKELRITEGLSVIGSGGTFYPRVAITGTGTFLVDNASASVYLPTAPTSGRVYSGDFDIRRGSLFPQARDVLGDELRHGSVLIAATNASPGKLTPSGTWDLYNDIYYDNNSSQFAFQPGREIAYRGNMYYRGGGCTLQGGGGTSAVNWYGRWIRWAPEGKELGTSVVYMYVSGGGMVFHGGYEDPKAPLTIWSASMKVALGGEVDLPFGVKFGSPGGTGGKLSFLSDLVSENPLPLDLTTGVCDVDLAGTEQRIGDISQAAGATLTVRTSSGKGVFDWMPSKDSTFSWTLSDGVEFCLDSEGVVGTLGSQTFVGPIHAKAGRLALADDAVLRNVQTLVVDDGATLAVGSSATLTDGVIVRLGKTGALDFAENVTVRAAKFFVDGVRQPAGTYTCGNGSLVVVDPLYTWTGAAGDGLFSSGRNWNYGEPPADGDAVKIAVSEDTAITYDLDGVTVGALTVETEEGSTVTLDGAVVADSIILAEGARLVLGSGATLTANGYGFGEGSWIDAEAAALVFAADGTYANVPVAAGVTLKIAAGTVTFATEEIAGGALRLEAYDASAVAVTSGLTLPVYTYKVDGEYVNPGEVQAGAGRLAVYTKPVDPAETWSVWTGGAGADDKSIFADANWAGGEAPDLASGSARLRFPDGAEVEIPNGVARAYELDVPGALTMSGTGRLAVGAGGATVGTGAVTMANGLEFLTTPQTWTVGQSSAALSFNGPLMAHDGLGPALEVVFAGNAAAGETNLRQVTFAAPAAEMMNATVVVSNLIPHVMSGTAFASEYGVVVWPMGHKLTDHPAMFHEKLTIDFPVTLYGFGGDIVDTTDPNRASLTFNKPVAFRRTSSAATSSGSVTWRGAVVFNDAVTADKDLNFYLAGGSTVTLNRKMSISGDFWFNGEGKLFLMAPDNKLGIVRVQSSGKIVCGTENALGVNDYIFYSKASWIDLGGFDQTVRSLWPNYGSATAGFVFTSERPAMVIVTTPHQYPSCVTCPYEFAGAAGIEYRLPSDKTETFNASVSTTKGPLSVPSGTIVFSGGAAWRGKSTVSVANGATLRTTEANTFSDGTHARTHLQLVTGAALELGADETVHDLTLDGTVCEPGKYGAPGSGAEHEMDCFTGTSILTVTSVPKPGIMLLVR